MAEKSETGSSRVRDSMCPDPVGMQSLREMIRNHKVTEAEVDIREPAVQSTHTLTEMRASDLDGLEGSETDRPGITIGSTKIEAEVATVTEIRIATETVT